MTGRELIIYILQNNLEDEPVFKDGKFIGFVTAGEVAAKLGVGIPTVCTLVYQEKLDGFIFNDTIHIPANYESTYKDRVSSKL